MDVKIVIFVVCTSTLAVALGASLPDGECDSCQSLCCEGNCCGSGVYYCCPGGICQHPWAGNCPDVPDKSSQSEPEMDKLSEEKEGQCVNCPGVCCQGVCCGIGPFLCCPGGRCAAADEDCVGLDGQGKDNVAVSKEMCSIDSDCMTGRYCCHGTCVPYWAACN